MRRTQLTLCLTLSLSVLAGCAHGPLSRGGDKKGEVVEAEGWTPLDPAKPLETKQRALSEAQKKAVEKVMGVTLSASTKVEASITLEQKILANIGGYIRNYEILSERAEGGFLKVRIRAMVLYQAPEPPPISAQTIRIAVTSGNESLAKAVRSALAAQGFSVSDQAKDADLVVTGEAKTYALSDSRLGAFRSYRAKVSLDVVKSKTGEMSHETQEASGLDTIDEIAQDKAIQIAGQLAGEALAKRLKGELKATTASSGAKSIQ